MYNKLFTKILDSSIWLESTPTRIVWLTMIAVMDQDGFAQFAAAKNVAHRARVTPAEAEDALHILENPDPDSSNPDNEGRRLERVPGGWLVLNADKHRQLVTRLVEREQNRIRVARHRGKKRESITTALPSITSNASEAEATTEEESGPVVLPNNQVPRNNPPTPLKGGRISRSDRQKAEHIRTKSWGLCKHEPRCNIFKDCVNRIARDISHGIAV